MKLIMESWRQFLKEEEQDTQGFMEFENIGQLKAALSAARSARNIRDLGKSGTATIAGAADLSSFGILPALKYIWKKTKLLFKPNYLGNYENCYVNSFMVSAKETVSKSLISPTKITSGSSLKAAFNALAKL